MKDVETVISRFRQEGLKITPQRMGILGFLMNNTDHPSAEDIYKQVLRIHPSISFTTVYKTLQTLRDMGEITELCIDPERAHYDPCIENHAHTFCTACHEIRDLPNEAAARIVRINDNSLIDGFDVRCIQVNFMGLCSKCKSSSELAEA